MKKLFFSLALISFSSAILCGCGKVDESPSEAANSASKNESIKITENAYLDTSDLTYVGKVTQEFAIGYEFENESDNDPILTYDQYESPDGEIFSFDVSGRLCYYRNSDDIFLGKNENDNKSKLSEAELITLSENIVSSFIDNNADCEASVSQEEDEYKVSSIVSEGAPAAALIKLADTGDVRSLCISHNTLSDPVDIEYFENKFNAYMDSVKDKYDISDYEYTVRYEQINDKIYALYNCSFVESDGAEFCELVGFTKNSGI